MVQKLTQKRNIENLNVHCRPYFVYVTLLNFYLAALVKTFVKHFVNCHSGFHTNHVIVFNLPQWPKLKNCLWFLVSFYAINVTFLEIFNGIIERMQE